MGRGVGPCARPLRGYAGRVVEGGVVRRGWRRGEVKKIGRTALRAGGRGRPLRVWF